MSESYAEASFPEEGVLRQLSLKTHCLLFVFDPYQKRFCYLSEYAAVLTGLDLSILREKPDLVLDSILPEDKANVLNELALIGEKECVEADFRMLMPNKSVKWICGKACVLGSPGQYQHFIAGYAEDISMRKEIELKLISTHAQKDVALQILGHDLRAPIGTISSAVALLEKNVRPEEIKELEPYFQIIRATSTKALNMIGEVLKSVYWEAQRFKPAGVSINLVEMVENQFAAYRLLQRDQKQFVLNAPSEAVYVNSDPVRLQLIIENLLSNAYKFTKRNGTVEVDMEESEGKVLLSIIDDGIGIPHDLQARIFEKFTSARREGMQGEKPMGLGLHLVKTLVEQLGGRIWFESREGEGTTFFVELPR